MDPDVKIELYKTEQKDIKISNGLLLMREQKDENLKESILNQGNESGSKPDFQCKICPYNTLRKPFLEKHMIHKHGFSKINVDKKHTNTCSEMMGVEIVTSTTLDEKIQSVNSTEFKCELCIFKTRYLNLLNLHQEIHKDKEEEVYQCMQCEFQTNEVNALRDHELTHKKPTLFNCPQCDYATRQKCNLKAHMKVHVAPEMLERFTCVTCKKFVSFYYSALLRHIKKKHGADGIVFKCDKCPFSARIQRHLLNHQKVHEGHDDAPMFKCDKCDFITYSEPTIRKHVQRHQERQQEGEEVIVKEQGEKREVIWFCCNLCDFRSKDQRYVILHKKVHTRVDEINKVGESIIQSKENKTKSNNEIS